MQGGLRQLPSVDRLLSHPQVAPLRDEYPHELVADMARRAIDDARQAVIGGGSPPSLDHLAAAMVRAVQGYLTAVVVKTSVNQNTKTSVLLSSGHNAQ